jgi:DNA (cytosine-5)-methyltransferase 1
MKLQPVPAIEAVDLFCGVGGLTHGLELGGINVRAGYDIDARCRYPYGENNSAEFHLADIDETNSAVISRHFSPGALTLIAGCAPCQPFSTLSRPSRKQGQLGDWQLVERFGEIVEDIQPDFVTMENVAQLAHHPVFSKFLKNLANYRVHWSISALSSVGVPQSRRRLVLVASRHGDVSFGATQSLRGVVTVRDVIAELPPIEAGSADSKDPLHTASRLSSLNLQRIRSSRPGGTWRDWDESLRAGCHTRLSGSTYPSVYGRMEWDKPAPTITTQCFGYGNGRFGHPVQDRAISLREAAMLQTFPRDYEFVPAGGEIKFSVLGRLIGNAVPVRLGECIGKMFVKHAQDIGTAVTVSTRTPTTV